MKKLIELTNEEAKQHFLKGSSYFNGDLPKYISFQPILDGVSQVMAGESFKQFQSDKPSKYPSVNYSLIANKDGKLAWRPYELIHPVIYVALVNIICEDTNWKLITDRFSVFESGVVDCCSSPVMSIGSQSDTATQITNWWQKVEQRSLAYSLEYSHVLHTDVSDCYGSLYTHSIPWALHGLEPSKRDKSHKLLGNEIDFHIQSNRYGQTNGISQGSVLMDFIAEIVLGYVDHEISIELKEQQSDFRILRYRDDYRVFANSDDRAESILKVISDKLRAVGMKLGVSKTYSCRNVIEGSIKPDKLACIELQDLSTANAKTIQKQLLRLHSFGQRFPNSGALKRLVSDFHSNISGQTEPPDDLEVQVAIATDIAFVSPSTFPAIAGILSYLIAMAPAKNKQNLWKSVRKKMERIPYNGYLEVWLQRVIQPRTVGLDFHSDEPLCKIVKGEKASLWGNNWISSRDLLGSLKVNQILVASAYESDEKMKPKEIALFNQNALAY